MIREVAVDDAAENGAPPELDPTLGRLVPVRVVVGGVDGVPVVGARVYAWSRPVGRRGLLADLALTAHGQPVTTAADGAFELRLPYGDTTQNVRAPARGDGRWIWSDEVAVTVGERGADPVRLALRAR